MVPYFLLAMGLDAADMGLLSAIMVIFTIIPAPVYGWSQDTFGPFATILVASLMCGLGCGLRHPRARDAVV